MIKSVVHDGEFRGYRGREKRISHRRVNIPNHDDFSKDFSMWSSDSSRSRRVIPYQIATSNSNQSLQFCEMQKLLGQATISFISRKRWYVWRLDRESNGRLTANKAVLPAIFAMKMKPRY